EVNTGRRRTMLTDQGRIEDLKDLVFHPDSRRFVTVSESRVRLWDSSRGTVIRTLSDSGADRAVWSLDGKRLLVGRGDKVTVLNTEGGQVREWSESTEKWSAFIFNPDGQWVVTGGEDGMLRIRDVQTGKVLATWQGHEVPISALTFSPDGNLLVSGAR